MTVDISADRVTMALSLTVLTALAMPFGALLAFVPRVGGKRFLSAALGLSAGVMVYVSLVGILPEAIEKLGYGSGVWAVVAFLAGMLLMALLDVLLPKHATPEESHKYDDVISSIRRDRLSRTGLILAATIAVHNFPEGMATFVTALDGVQVALPLAVAICIHNVPMGIAMSTPIYYGTGSRRKALVWTFCSGMAAVAGALLALFFLLPWWTAQLEAICMAAVAGVMLYIAFDELLPEAEAAGHHRMAIGGLVVGVAIMAFCLLLFGHTH